MSRNFFNIISAVFFVVIATNPATAQYVNRLESAGFNTDKTSIYIEDLKTGEVVLDLNGELPLIPASVMKIVTAASVLSSGDSSARFRTRVTTNGTIENGILKGDIILYASGDPTVESAFFPSTAGITDSIAEKIVSMGVNMINGDVIISYPSWMEEPVPAGWKDTDLIRPYGTGYHAFNYADNRMAIKFPSLKTNPPVLSDRFVEFTLNDKFRFRRELFGNSDIDMNEALDVVDAMTSREEVEDYFYNDMCWDPNNEDVKDFIRIVTAKFTN